MGQSIYRVLINPVRGLAVALIALTITIFSSELWANDFVTNLENGVTVSARSGASFSRMMLVQGNYVTVEQSITKDLKSLTTLFPEVKFMRLYQTPSGRRLVYLKLASFGDGVGVLMEVVSGAEGSFRDAVTIPEPTTTRNFSKIPVDLDEAKSRVETELRTATARDELQRSISSGTSIVIQGPLNELESMPYLGLRAILSVDRYDVRRPWKAGQPIPLSDDQLAKVGTYPVISVRVGFTRMSPTREFGDFRGLDLDLADRVGLGAFLSLQSSLKQMFVNQGVQQ